MMTNDAWVGRVNEAGADWHDALYRADLATAALPAVLQHVLENDVRQLLSAEVLVRVEAMLQSLAAEIAGITSHRVEAELPSQIAACFRSNTHILCYIHATVLEAMLAQRLQYAHGIAAQSPMLKRLAQDGPVDLVQLAGKVLAAEARFQHSYLSTHLSWRDLPADIRRACLQELRGLDAATGAKSAEALDVAGSQIAREALLKALVTHPQVNAVSGFDLADAGLALFISAVSARLQQDRSLLLLTAAEGRSVRFALSLRAAGLPVAEIERCFWLLNADCALSQELGSLSADNARDVLSRSSFQQ